MIIVWDDFERVALPERLFYSRRAGRAGYRLEVLGYTTGEFKRLGKNSTQVKDAVRHGLKLVR